MNLFRPSKVLGVACAISILMLDPTGSCDDLVPAGDVVAAPVFLQQFKQGLMKARPGWTEAECADIADAVASQLGLCTRVQLTSAVASNLLDYIELDLHKIDSSADDHVFKMTKEYFRWSLEYFCQRDDMLQGEKSALLQNITDCFAKAVDAMKKDLPRELQAQADASMQANLKYIVDCMEDPLYPGLKALIATDEFDKFLETFTNSWAMKKSAFERLGGGSILKFKQKPLTEEFIAWGIEIPFRVLGQQMAEFGVELDEALKNAVHDYYTSRPVPERAGRK